MAVEIKRLFGRANRTGKELLTRVGADVGARDGPATDAAQGTHRATPFRGIGAICGCLCTGVRWRARRCLPLPALRFAESLNGGTCCDGWMKDALLEKMAGEITLSAQPGPTIRKWREAFEVSQSELAGQLAVNPSVVSDYESGRRKSPGIGTVRRIVEALVGLDEHRGGHVLARYHSLLNPTEGILAIGEYRRSVPGQEFLDRIDARALVLGNLADKSVQGYTLIDSLKAIASLNATDYVRVYGWNTQRALVFTGIKYGRSPMIAIRVHPMKPSVVVYHRPEDVDKLAYRLAEYEQIPLLTTDLELPELQARLHGLAG